MDATRVIEIVGLVVAGLLAAKGLIRFIVELTPTKVDDRIARKVFGVARALDRALSPKKGGPNPALLLPALIVGVGLMGCAPAVTTAEIGPDGAQTTNQGADQALITMKPIDTDDDGTPDRFVPSLTGSHQGAGAEASMIDGKGIWQVNNGPGLTAAYNPETGYLYLRSPKDTSAESIRYTPVPAEGEPMLVAKGLRANISDPIAETVKATMKRAEVLAGMTQTEARKQIEQWKEAGEITADVADLLLQTVVPHLPNLDE